MLLHAFAQGAGRDVQGHCGPILAFDLPVGRLEGPHDALGFRLGQRPGPGGQPELPMEVQALRFGDVALVAFAAETFSAIGHEIKQKAPAPHTFFVGTANGCIGYLATAEAHAEGGYEVEEAPLPYRISGRFDPGGAAAATARGLEMVSRLYAAGPRASEASGTGAPPRP